MKEKLLSDLTLLMGKTPTHLRFYFYTKDNKLFRPHMKEDLSQKLISVQLNFLKGLIGSFNSIEEYDLEGNLKDDMCYYPNYKELSEFSCVKNLLNLDEYYTLEESEVEPFYSKIKAIVLVIDNELTIFKKFYFPKRLIKNSIFSFKKYPLNQIEDDVFTVDNRVEIFEFNNNIYILNNSFFEFLFDLESEYSEKLSSTKHLLEESNIIDESDVFIEKCLNSKRLTKKLIKLLKENNFNSIKNNISQVETVILDNDLDIEINRDGLINGNISNHQQLINLLGDNYYTSSILGEKRLAEKSKKIQGE